MEKTKSEILAEYYTQHATPIFRSAYAAVQDKFDAEVIVQDTFLTASEKFDDFISSPNPVGWLYNTMKFMIKRLYHERSRFKNFVPYEEEVSPVGVQDEHSVFLEYRGLIPDKQLKLMINFHCNRYSCDDLSQMFGQTEMYTRVNLSRGRAKFRKAYRKEQEKIK